MLHRFFFFNCHILTMEETLKGGKEERNRGEKEGERVKKKRQGRGGQ